MTIALTGLEIVVLIGGTVVVIVVVYALSSFFRSERAIVSKPEEVHVRVGALATLTVVLLRKKSGDFNPGLPRRDRPVTFERSQTEFGFLPNVNAKSKTVISRTSVVSINLKGLIQGRANLTVKADSSQPDRMYGPLEIDVHVHDQSDSLPEGVTLTPVLDESPNGILVGRPPESDEGG